MALQSVRNTEGPERESDREDLYRTLWADCSLPQANTLESLDRQMGTAWMLVQMLNQHLRGQSDARNNAGIRYSWLTEAQAGALGDAVEELMTDGLGKLEQLREV